MTLSRSARRVRNRTARAKALRRLHLHLALIRQGWACHYCGAPLMLREVLSPDGPFWRSRGLLVATLEHLRPRAVGGTDDLDNCAAACVPCNTGRADNPQQDHDDPNRLRFGDEVFVREGRRWRPSP